MFEKHSYAIPKKDEFFSSDMFGLKPFWRYSFKRAGRTRYLENEEEVFLLTDPLLPHQIEFHRLVEEALSALPKYIRRGYTIAIEPFRISAGKCAVIQDAGGIRTCLFEKAQTPPYFPL